MGGWGHSHAEGCLDDLVLADASLALVGGDLRGEESLQLGHGGRDDVLVAAAYPLLGRREHQLQHALLRVRILLHEMGMTSAKHLQVMSAGGVWNTSTYPPRLPHARKSFCPCSCICTRGDR